MMGIDGWYINPNSKNQQAAIEFALYAFGKDGLTLYRTMQATLLPVRTLPQLTRWSRLLLTLQPVVTRVRNLLSSATTGARSAMR